MLDAELAALLLALAQHDVPLVIASREAADAERLGRALAGPAADGIARGGSATGGRAPGVLIADSLDDVVRLAGGRGGGEVPDELRDIGVVVVMRRTGDGMRVVAAHYVRPLERDAGGHVQRRGPAVLATYDESAGEWSHFAWAVTAELAERAGVHRHELEDEVDRLRARLAPAHPGRPR